MSTICSDHKKENIGNCMWCGKSLCPLCIVKQEGRKYYCVKCVRQLGV